VTDVVDAALPKAVPSIAGSDTEDLADEDVEAELRGLEEKTEGT
jgi:hypothetical protein